MGHMGWSDRREGREMKDEKMMMDGGMGAGWEWSYTSMEAGGTWEEQCGVEE